MKNHCASLAPLLAWSWSAFGVAWLALLSTSMLGGATGDADGARAQEAATAPPRPELRELAAKLLEQHIYVDFEAGLCSIPVVVDVRDDFLEYVLVNPHGAAHESLFVTDVVPSQLNVALLALGVEPGKNAVWVRKDPPPTPEELAKGVRPYDLELPTGGGVHMYAAWRQGGETFFYRLEDLIRNLDTGRSMRRHSWTYIGSRMVRSRTDGAQRVFAADIEGNLVNLALFEQGNTLITASLSECLLQTIWLPNAWLLPESGAKVELVFCREARSSLTSALEARLPVIVDAEAKREAR